MTFLANAAVPLLGVVGGLLGLGKKSAPPVQALATVTRDDAAALAASDDALRRRKGSAADMLTGTRGAEAAIGTTGKLVIGN